MASVGKSVVQSTLAHFGNLAISLALVVAVSRILPPEAVGVFLMAYAVMLLVLPLRDFQLSSFVIQRDAIDWEVAGALSFVAWTSSGVALTTCLAVSAIFFAFYPGEGIAECLLIASTTFLIRPYSLLASAMLARESQYGSLAWLKLSGAVARAVATLGLLALGQGPEALAWGLVAENVVGLFALLLVKREFWLARPRVAGSREIFAYCAPFTGAHLVITLSTAITPILIGGYQGLAMTAFFNRGRTVTQFFRSGVEGAIQPIVLTEFSRAKHDIAELRAVYLKATGLMTGLAWPALAWLIASALHLSVTAFGPEWAQTAPLAQFLSVAALIYAATAWSHQLHAAIDQTKLLLLREGLLQIPLLGFVIVLAPISTQAVAFGMIAAAAISFVAHMALLQRSLALSPKQLASAVSKSAVVAIVTGGSTWALAGMLEEHTGQLWALSLLAAAGAISWLIASAVMRHPILDEARTFRANLRASEAKPQAGLPD